MLKTSAKISKDEAAQKLADDMKRVRLLEERERKNGRELALARIQLQKTMSEFGEAYGW